MNTITAFNVDYTTQTALITLDSGFSFTLGFQDLYKIQIKPTLGDQPAVTSFPGLTITPVEFTPAIQEAIKVGIINYTQALIIYDYTNRGFANPQASPAGNLLQSEYPDYITFLTQYRANQGDPNIT